MLLSPAVQTLLHPDTHEEGGLAMNNRALLEQQRGAIFELIRDMGKQLLTGHINLVNLSMPVKMFEPRSYLEKLSDVWVHSRILTKAASCDDQLLRLKWVVTWCVYFSLQLTQIESRYVVNSCLGTAAVGF